MPLGTFVLTIGGEQQDGTAENKARLHLLPQGVDTLIDADADEFKFPTKFAKATGVAISLPYTITLFTDSTSGASTTIGYKGYVATENGGRVDFEIAAQQAGTTTALTDLTDEVVFPISTTQQYRDEAETARDEAVAAAASVPTDAELSATLERRLPKPFTELARRKHEPVYKAYAPAGLANVSSNTSGTTTSVDSTNLKVRFVAPESGKVRWRLSASGKAPATFQVRWSLRVGTPATPTTVLTVASTLTTVLSADTANALEATRASAEGVLDKDGAGAALIPGVEYVVEWGHSANTAGSAVQTTYGSNVGAAIMEINPVVVSATESAYTPTIAAAGGFIPYWLSSDRTTFIGTLGSTWRVAWSTDDGATTGQTDATFAREVQQVRETDDGEILVFVANHAGERCSIWKSSGWKANHQTATFTKTFEETAAFTTGNWRAWSHDSYGSLVIIAPYGTQSTGPTDTNTARHIYLSNDYGVTWSTIFDLLTAPGVSGTGAHMHGIAYDPWWDAIWAANGDGSGNWANWVSFDRGTTWTKLSFTHQCTAIYALPGCILFVSDQGPNNGIYRIPRTSPKNLTAELAYLIDASSSLIAYGNQMFRLRSTQDAPLVISTEGGSGSGPGRLFVTYDGYTIRELWKDSTSYTDQGLRSGVGPSKNGVYLGRLDRSGVAGSPNANAEKLTLTPTP